MSSPFLQLSPVSARVSRSSRCRSEEHTSELQSQSNLVCRLLLEKKKKTQHQRTGAAAPRLDAAQDGLGGRAPRRPVHDTVHLSSDDLGHRFVASSPRLPPVLSMS